MLLLLITAFSRIINPAHFDAAYMNKCLMTRLATYRPVSQDSTCQVASMHHANYMAVKQTITHYEDANYRGALYSINERKVDGEICLTYLAYSSYYELSYEQLADKMVENWLKSPEHKAVFMNKELKKAAASVVYNPKDDTYYAVINFRYK